jgi:hypothetical protein
MFQSFARTESWESRPPEPPSTSAAPARVCGDQVFRERLRDCSVLPSDCRRLLLFPRIVSSPFWWTFEGLHCELRPTSTVVRDIEQHTMSTSTRGAAGALSMGPSARYNSILEFVKFNIFSAMICMSFMFISANLL